MASSSRRGKRRTRKGRMRMRMRMRMRRRMKRLMGRMAMRRMRKTIMASGLADLSYIRVHGGYPLYEDMRGGATGGFPQRRPFSYHEVKLC